MHSLPRAPALSRVLAEADDIAHATGLRTTTAHALLALFTVKNRAERLMRDRGVDEDRILERLPADSKEPKHVLEEIVERAAQVAAGCGAREVSCLHLLVAMTRSRESVAARVLEACGEKLPQLRTRALTILTGAIPRWGDSTPPAEELEHVSVLPKKRTVPARGVDRAERRAALDWTPPIVEPKKKRTVVSPSVKRPSTQQPPPEAAPIAESEALPETMPDFAQPSMLPEPIEEAPPKSAAQWTLSTAIYPWLTSLGRNLSAEAASGKLDRLTGREKEIDELIDILGKRRANNPCLVGEPGVGKTAVVEGLALRLVQERTPPALKKKIIVSLDVGALLVGTHLRGSFSEKLQGLKDEVKSSDGRVIVFFDELHTLVGAGSTGDGPQDAANELKSALARGDFPCIGATTRDEWIKHIEADPALKRRFYPVLVKEPSREDALVMIRYIIPEYATHHGVNYSEEALSTAVNLSARYITDRHLPDKAIALLDLAGSRASRSGSSSVGAQLIATLVSEQTDLPVERLLSSDRDRLLQLESFLEREIVGHKKELGRIASVIRRNAAGFSSKRPQGAFLFLGPTGVGKTETAKALAKVLHGSEDMMIRFDLSEFSEPHAVARLVGAPPGYVGHDAGGQLTESVRRRPGRVVLFDEIEKAHRDVLQVLLQILDEGRLTDGRGQTVSFAETIIVLTSNLGSDLRELRRPIGFSATREERNEIERAVLDRAKEALPPELWSRIEDRLVFAPLIRDEVQKIARLLAIDSSARLTRERGISYTLDDRAVDFLLDQGGYDAMYGARPMRQILARIVEAPIAARILEGRLYAGEHVLVSTRANSGLAFLVGDEHTSLSQRPRRV